MHKRLFGVDAKKIGGDTGYAGTANRDLCKELAVTTVVNICSLETLAVFVFLYGLAIALSIMVNTLEAGAVSVVYHHLSLYPTIEERAFEYVARLLGKLSVSVLLVCLPVARIDIPITPYECALTGLVALNEMA